MRKAKKRFQVGKKYRIFYYENCIKKEYPENALCIGTDVPGENGERRVVFTIGDDTATYNSWIYQNPEENIDEEIAAWQRQGGKVTHKNEMTAVIHSRDVI